MQSSKNIIFFCLSAFEFTGGIEKFNKCFIKALEEIQTEEPEKRIEVVSTYDQQADSRYLNRIPFRGFKRNKLASVWYVLKQARKTDILILGHINLSIAGLIAKILNPKIKVIMITHGIEVWQPLPFVKHKLLKIADTILAVSQFTKNQMVYHSKIDPFKIQIFHNTLDPYFKVPDSFEKPEYLLNRYGLTKNNKIVFTLSRLVSSEKYKGYDKVIEAIAQIAKSQPEIRYVLAGKYDEKEYRRIQELVALHDAKRNVLLTGFVKEEEVTDHYLLADVFIMPSRKEGFGIVFLEAMACGVPVIGGNEDGTVEALKNGELGILLNVSDFKEITRAITNSINLFEDDMQKLNRQTDMLLHFGFPNYKNQFFSIINDESNSYYQ